MKVLKFGGTSVGTLEALRSMRDIVLSQTGSCVIVVSALGGMTDSLVSLCGSGVTPEDVDSRILEYRMRFEPLIQQLVPDSLRSSVSVEIDALLTQLATVVKSAPQPGREEIRADLIVSFGERMSSTLITAMFDHAVKADALGMIFTDGSRRSLDHDRSFAAIRGRIRPAGARVTVVPGFIALDPAGEVCNLGRGGSDYTAAIIACALGAERLEIWTDVDGYMTADPRTDASASLIERLTYDEAFDMSSRGAKVVFAPTIEIIKDHRIPIAVRNTFRPHSPHSLVC